LKGAELVSEVIEVVAPAKEASVMFNRKVKVPAGAAGWKYEIVS
jgi:hypothetical protein